MSNMTELEQAFGHTLPKVISEYLLRSREWLREDGLVIYDYDSIVERNKTLGVQEFRDDYFAVGDDSGGKVVVVRFDDEEGAPFLIGAGALVPNAPSSFFKPLAASWTDWEQRRFPL